MYRAIVIRFVAVAQAEAGKIAEALQVAWLIKEELQRTIALAGIAKALPN